MAGAGFDEYEYLERQLDANGVGAPHRDYGHKSRSSDYDRAPRGSSSRDPRYGKRERSRSRERRSRQSPRRSRSPRGGRRREKTPPEVALAREKERELQELERTTRTVFAYNLNLKAEERELFEFFSKAGTITDMRMIMDRNTRKSKGLAYVEFARQEDVFNALSLTGQILMGQAVMVKASEAEKNLAWEAQQQAKQASGMFGAAAAPVAGPCKLQVSNLHVGLSEADLKQLFEPFGGLESVQIQRDMMGRPVGMAMLQYRTMQDAMKAMQHWNGKALVDKLLVVQIAHDPSTSISGAGLAATTVLGELDEEENLKLTAQGRAALMSRLANSAGMAPVLAAVVPGVNYPGAGPAVAPTLAANPLALEQGVLGPSSPIPTPCLLLKNMFDPKDNTGPSWVTEIAQDVSEECSKFGRVLHCYVDSNSKGFVYLKFDTLEAAQAAQRTLNGRFYSGHQILAEFQFAQVYQHHFKC